MKNFEQRLVEMNSRFIKWIANSDGEDTSKDPRHRYLTVDESNEDDRFSIRLQRDLDCVKMHIESSLTNSCWKCIAVFDLFEMKEIKFKSSFFVEFEFE